MALQREQIMVTLAAWLVYFIVGGVTGSALQVAWNTDGQNCTKKEHCTPLGPDGPWHALGLRDSGPQGPWFSLYPASNYPMDLLIVKAGGLYDVKKPNSSDDEFAKNLGQADDIDSGIYIDIRNSSRYNDTFTLPTSQLPFTFRVGVNAMYGWTNSLPNGTSYTPFAGRFGLGPERDGGAFRTDPPAPPDQLKPPGLLEQLKAEGRIAACLFALHIGCAGLGQSASLTLGGYEQNRVIGPVGSFQNDLLDRDYEGRILLIDLLVGVQEGFVDDGSSLFQGNPGITAQMPLSVWRGPLAGGSGASAARVLGGPDGSASVRIDPQAPYLYLPPGTCEALARLLPVLWRTDIKYWVWNTTDAAFSRLISHPAYLGFVFLDQKGTNITIKLPFALLNLTLTHPITTDPTPYFPCQTRDPSSGVWQLGRAFLQGAFFAMNFDEGLTYLAQAPGPGMKKKEKQSNLQTVNLGDTTIVSSPASMFVETWQPYWKTSHADEGQSPGLKGGAIAGITVGGLVVVLAMIFCAAALTRWHNKTKRAKKPHHDAAMAAQGPRGNKSQTIRVPEASSAVIPVELVVPDEATTHEMPGDQVRVELPTPATPVESSGQCVITAAQLEDWQVGVELQALATVESCGDGLDAAEMP